ncbi:mechanosensitive ion channel family protein [Thauera linaloolentis]|uniref:Small-conductance mechanosensitive channel n=1 Tax=Thauera linaloolentis (strain DSM 12138 / JCM 21573 / CCUG 41526 / CIP 105981 / IAM 15112 / NBRC 102519 / 47Lol) TaxID=1123367 RepID=N6Y1L2_THAL4|nr:mechanosensitive ion channel domain-containing protein [Thauera linaloolentis]ENO88076.1 mechanosensitive ion channel protein MscS [Thauera linaloolentis 47Lol = DSM 12138]MCM8565213.1 mechanosensitive ion channel [Thauera linaloolentis]
MLERLAHLDWIETYALPWGINLLLALGTFIVGRWIAHGIVAVARRMLAHTRLDAILVNFILSILQGVLLLIVVIAALNRLGIDTTSLVALIGAAGLAVGLALQDSLKNFAAGVMLIVFRPFKAGDFVEAGGTSGSVERISIFSSTFRTADNREIIVPNGVIYSGVITNYSTRPTRRIDLLVRVSYDDDIRRVKAIIEQVLHGDARVLAEPAPFIGVADLADNSVDLHVRPWVATADHFAASCELKEKVKIAFDENGITIPYPQMDMYQHVVHVPASGNGST